MNAKSKIKIYKKIIEEVCREYNGAREFIVNKVKELFSQEGISARRYVRPETYSVLEYLFVCFVMLRTQFRVNLFSLSF